MIYGLGGADVLYGDAGNDVLDGGAGEDKLDGGPGKDTTIQEGRTHRSARPLLRGAMVWMPSRRYSRRARFMAPSRVREEPHRGPPPSYQAREGAIAREAATATSAASATFMRSNGTKMRTPCARATAKGSSVTTESQVAPTA